MPENANALYGIVLYQAADCLPHPCSDTLGPFTVACRVLNALDKLEWVIYSEQEFLRFNIYWFYWRLIGGKGESCANIAEGLAAALQCFEELQQTRDTNVNVQRHCILVCNSPPYLLPVMECHNYAGKTVDQLAVILQEVQNILKYLQPSCLFLIFRKT